MKFSIPESVTRTVAMSVLKGKKHSPTILFGSGVVLGVATVVSACRSTLKFEGILEDAQKDLADTRRLEHSSEFDYTEHDRQKDTLYIYIRTAARLTKLYAPALVLGIGSVACLTQSHRILSSRNAGLTAAYAALDKGFKEYRRRVVDEYGEDKDRELRYGVQAKAVEVQGKDGKTKTKKVKVVGDGGGSIYSRFFDENNQNWCDQPEYNMAFLKLQLNYANDRLRSRGHLFLNEVYDMLSLDRTPEGSQVGWLWNKGNGDGYVSFGLFDQENEERLLDFMTGREGGIWLDFNVDGPIWKDI